MITIISGTNRPNSNSIKVAHKCLECLAKQRPKSGLLLNLERLNGLTIDKNMYDKNFVNPTLSEIQNKFVFNSNFWIIIAPEYNGSISGALKFFIDAISVHNYEKNFRGKKVALIGVSAGKAGNLIGISHLRDMFNYLGMTVFPTYLPLSSIDSLQDNGQLNITTQK